MHRKLASVVLASSLVFAVGYARADGYEAPRVAAPLMLQPSNWTGFYANGGLGYEFWEADTTTVNPVTGACVVCATQNQGGNGWLGEIGLGYDAQISDKIVLGAFADYDFSSVRGTIGDQFNQVSGKTNNDSTWFVGARAGWLMTPQVLNYYNVGYTHAHFGGANMGPTGSGGGPAGFATSNYDGNGWFVGGGLEVAMGSGWFWRSEVRFAQYSKQTLSDTNGAGAQLDNITFEPVVQTATSEIVYKFNWGP
jgi:outer membrane immunogenic protein